MSNRTGRDNLVNSSFDEDYTYDDLSQLVSFARGSHTQDFDYDAVGNWDSLTTDGTAQTRTANKQNEITSISGATTPTYDDNGNMTGDETGRQFVYDAWNRLVIVKNSGGTTLETFKYDGLNRRVSSDDGTTTTDLYYSSDWQVLSEKVGSNDSKRYVWSPVYVDAMMLRDRDTDSNGSLDERLWVQQDANWNVTALVDGSGTVVERYAYDPYGVQTVYDASYTVRTGGSAYDFNHGFQEMWYDATAGLNPQRERWYSPTLGRWVTMDPISFTAGDVNLYRFEVNSPTNRTDPSGLQPPKNDPLIQYGDDDVGDMRRWKDYLKSHLRNPARGGAESPISALFRLMKNRKTPLQPEEIEYLNILKREIGRLGLQPAQVEKDVIAAATNLLNRNHPPSPVLTQAALSNLFGPGGPFAIHANIGLYNSLIHALGSDDFQERELALRQLKALAKNTKDPLDRWVLGDTLLRAVLTDPNPEIRARLATIIPVSGVLPNKK